ncbi:MAG: hypothetical protein R3A79_11195 [Nannocystaceae bacterium]
MPDDNKFTKLRAIHYRIPPTCDTCIHGQLAAGSQWGTCALHRYLHAKHANPESGRGVSVRADGTCPNHQVDPAKLAAKGLGAHAEFFG